MAMWASTGGSVNNATGRGNLMLGGGVKRCSVQPVSWTSKPDPPLGHKPSPPSGPPKALPLGAEVTSPHRLTKRALSSRKAETDGHIGPTCPVVWEALEILAHLLRMHEVKLVLRLIEEWLSQSMADKTSPSDTTDVFVSVTEEFVESQNRSYDNEALQDLQRWCSATRLRCTEESAGSQPSSSRDPPPKGHLKPTIIISNTTAPVTEESDEDDEDIPRPPSRSLAGSATDLLTSKKTPVESTGAECFSNSPTFTSGIGVVPTKCDEDAVASCKVGSTTVPRTSTSSGDGSEQGLSMEFRERARGRLTIRAFRDRMKMKKFWCRLSENVWQVPDEMLVAEMQEERPTHRFILQPNGVLRISWDCASLIAIMNEAILVPLSLCFDGLDLPEFVWIASMVFFMFDIAVNFVTGFYRDGHLVMQQRPIAWHYFRSWLLLDIVSTFPWHVITEGSRNATMLKFVKFGKLARVLRLLRVAKISMLVEQFEQLFASAAVAVVVKLVKIMCSLGVLCHWSACIWAWIGHPSRHTGEQGQSARSSKLGCEPGGPCEDSISGSAWRRRYGVDEDPLIDQYLFALRFAAGIFTGSDFGIQPGYWCERVFVIILMFFSFVLISIIISKIVVMFAKLTQEMQDQEETMLNFREFMAASRVPLQLQTKIKRYMEFQFKSRKEINIRRFDLIDQLSPWLKKELQVHLNKNILQQHMLFREMPMEILAQICNLARAEIYAPGDIIVQRGQHCTCMYFLVRGKLTIGWEAPKSNLSIGHARQTRMGAGCEEDDDHVLMNPPGYFCASSLFNDEVQKYTVSSVTHAEVLKLHRMDIKDLATEFPSISHYVDFFRQRCKDHIKDCSMSLGSILGTSNEEATELVACRAE